MSAALPIVKFLSSASNEFNEEWSSSPSATEQAELLQSLGSHAAIACNAALLVNDIPPEAAGFDALLREGARVRHAWVEVAVEQLKCCGSSINAEMELGNVDTSGILAMLVTDAAELIASHGLTPMGDWHYIDKAIGVEMTIDADWLVSSQGLSPVFHAPFELNGRRVEGLGPDSWRLGTALRIRRLRNSEPLTAAEASSRFIGLISRQGMVTGVKEIKMAGLSALRHDLAPELPSWSASVTVLVAGGFTYIVESGCPEDVPGACSSLKAVAATLRISQ